MRRALLLVLLAGLAAPAAADRGDAGSNAGDFLRLGHGAAPAAQGEAYVARGGVLESLQYNPAGLALIDRPGVLFAHNQYLLDVTSNHLGIGIPLGGRWALGGSVSALDYGDFTRRTISNPGGVGTFDAGAFSGGLTLARRLTSAWSLGATVKGFDEEIDDANRSGYAIDVGLHYRSVRGILEAGVAVRNVGGRVRFDTVREAIAAELSAGASVRLFEERLRLSGEVVDVRDQEVEFRGGAEFAVVPRLLVRAGYDSRNDLGEGYSLGLGFEVTRNFQLDYAYVPFRQAGDSHRVSLTAYWGDSPETGTAESP